MRCSKRSRPPRISAPGMRTSARTTSAVCDARIPCFLNFCPCDSPGVSGGTMNVAWPRVPNSGYTDATTMWTAAMPPFVAHVRAGARLGGAERRDLRISWTAEHLGKELTELLGRSARRERSRSQTRPEDGQRDTSIAPEHLLEHGQQPETAGFSGHLREQLRRVQADFRGLSDDRPRRLLALIPFGGGGPDHLGGKLVHPVTNVHNFFRQFQRETCIHDRVNLSSLHRSELPCIHGKRLRRADTQIVNACTLKAQKQRPEAHPRS